MLQEMAFQSKVYLINGNKQIRSWNTHNSHISSSSFAFLLMKRVHQEERDETRKLPGVSEEVWVSALALIHNLSFLSFPIWTACPIGWCRNCYKLQTWEDYSHIFLKSPKEITLVQTFISESSCPAENVTKPIQRIYQNIDEKRRSWAPRG